MLQKLRQTSISTSFSGKKFLYFRKVSPSIHDQCYIFNAYDTWSLLAVGTSVSHEISHMRRRYSALSIIYIIYLSSYVPVKLKLENPPGHTLAFDASSCQEGGLLITTHKGWGICSLATWANELWRRRQRQTLMNSKEKVAYSWWIG